MALVRTIYVVGDINEEAFLKFSKHLAALERENTKAITIELSSEGGTAMDALAFRGRMLASPCPLTVRGFGLVASAATMILISGDKRYMAADSYFMVHEDSAGKIKGRTSDLSREARHAQRMEDTWNAIFALCSNISANAWAKLHKDQIFLSAKECLEIGAIDEVL